jgi:hypothetical protein
MATRSYSAIAAVLVVAGCAAVNPYPAAWDPLPAPSSTDCKHFEGRYADKADSRDYVKPSLTRELFGFNTDWEKATRVDFSLLRDDMLEVTVWSGTDKMLTRTFSAAEGELACDAGRLILRNTRWVRADVMFAREKAKLTLHKDGDYLVTEVKDDLTGLFFVIVPIVGSVTNWYRFAKIL